METWVIYVFLTLLVGLSCLLCQLQKHVFYKQMHNETNKPPVTHTILLWLPNHTAPTSTSHLQTDISA
jgi:hypothetical protein